MANALQVESIITTEQAEAASKALIDFQKSADDCLQYLNVFKGAVETKKALVRTEIELRKKDETIGKLESAISIFTLRGNKEVSRVKMENAEAMKLLEIVTEEKERTNVMLKNSEQSLEKLERESAKMRSEVSELKTSNDNLAINLRSEIAAKKEATDRLRTAEMQLSLYNNYTTNLVHLNTAKLYVILLSRF